MTTKAELQTENERLKNEVAALKSVLEGDDAEYDRLQERLDKVRGDYRSLVKLATEYLGQRDKARAWALYVSRELLSVINNIIFEESDVKYNGLGNMFENWFGLKLPGPHLCDQDWREVE
jgi:hypothetical protein